MEGGHQGQSVLAVDDDPQLRKLLQYMLAPLGCRVVTADSGAQAFELLRQQTFDLIIVDLMMPGSTGLDVVERVRAGQADGDVPIIVATAYDDPEMRLRCIRAGADEFITKPIRADLLLARAKRLLRMRASTTTALTQRDEISHIQRAQSELVEFLVHDLKNPLTVADANLAFLADFALGADPEARGALEDAQEALRRMSRMVGEILLVARLEEPTFVVERRLVDLTSMIEDVRRSHHRQAARKGVQLATATSAPLQIRADDHLVLRALDNLVENAVRHTPSGGTVELSAEAQGEALVRVANSGRPIEPKTQRQLFEKFIQGEQRVASGTNVGLGLYFCRLVAEAHGGTIALVPSKLATCFELRLPLQAA